MTIFRRPFSLDADIGVIVDPSIMQRLLAWSKSAQLDWPFVAALTLGELVLGWLIIKKVPYTEIDWQAYMEEVDGWWVGGEYDYRNLRGGTGPLVYPAGFLYLFLGLQKLSNRDIYQAQLAFLCLYTMAQCSMFTLYTCVVQQVRREIEAIKGKNSESKLFVVVWSLRFAMAALCLSKRYHSIFLLRLFNDGPTMLVAYLSFWCFLKKKWNFGCFLFSVAVSLKMNVLLFAPGLLYLLIRDSPIAVIPRLSICAFTQVILGAPFLFRYPESYLRKAFELDRKFFFKWTVNFRFLPESWFLSSRWALCLLALHVGLAAFFFIREYRQDLGNELTPRSILRSLFVSNLIGIACARTLHYQFYSWYFPSLPFLLWESGQYGLISCTVILGVVEYSFLTFPSTPLSSAALNVAHWAILIPILTRPSKQKHS